MNSITPYRSWLRDIPKEIVREQILPFLDPGSLAKVRRVCRQAHADASLETLWVKQLSLLPPRLYSVGPGVTAHQALLRIATMMLQFRHSPCKMVRYPYDELLNFGNSHTPFALSVGLEKIAIWGQRLVIPLYESVFGKGSSDFEKYLGNRAAVLIVDIESKANQRLELSHPKDPYPYRLRVAVAAEKIFALYPSQGKGIIDVWEGKNLNQLFKTISIDDYYPEQGVISDGHLFVSLTPFDWPTTWRTSKICFWKLSNLEQTGFYTDLKHDDFFLFKCFTVAQNNFHCIGYGSKLEKKPVDEWNREGHGFHYDPPQIEIAGSRTVSTQENKIYVHKGNEGTLFYQPKAPETGWIYTGHPTNSSFEILGNYLLFPETTPDQLSTPGFDIRKPGKVAINHLNLDGDGHSIKEDILDIQKEDGGVKFFQGVNGDFWLQTLNAIYRINYEKEIKSGLYQWLLNLIYTPPKEASWSERREPLESLIPSLRQQ